MRRLSIAALALGVLALSPSALADDSLADLAVGGLVLTKSTAIRMASEDLYISPKAVRVRYTFVNDSAKDIDSIVAFPLPDEDNYFVSTDMPNYGPPDWFDDSLPPGIDSNPGATFVLQVDGKKVVAKMEQHAFHHGKDVTALLRAAGALPVMLSSELSQLTAAQLARLAAAGLVEKHPNEDPQPKWISKVKFWWKQHFGAGKTVTIDHSYRPITGSTMLAPIDLRHSNPNDFRTQLLKSFYAKYCIDDRLSAMLQAIDKRRKNSGIDYYTTGFILVTAANWKGPIGRFHLTIDKLDPANLAFLCWWPDLKKAGLTRFEATRTNFAPTHDINLLVLR